MMLLFSGGLFFVVTTGLFIRCLPRNGQCYRFADTWIEPYIAVAFTAGLALSFTLILSAVLDMIG
jgi:hypothetical protein